MVGWLNFNIIEKIPFTVYLEIQCITFKMEKSYIAHPWIQRSVVGLEACAPDVSTNATAELSGAAPLHNTPSTGRYKHTHRAPWLSSWWRHQMDTFSALLASVRGIHRSPVNSPHKGQWRGALMFSLICAWIKGWVNIREAGNLIRYHAHYDVTVMMLRICHLQRN